MKKITKIVLAVTGVATVAVGVGMGLNYLYEKFDVLDDDWYDDDEYEDEFEDDDLDDGDIYNDEFPLNAESTGAPVKDLYSFEESSEDTSSENEE